MTAVKEIKTRFSWEPSSPLEVYFRKSLDKSSTRKGLPCLGAGRQARWPFKGLPGLFFIILWIRMLKRDKIILPLASLFGTGPCQVCFASALNAVQVSISSINFFCSSLLSIFFFPYLIFFPISVHPCGPTFPGMVVCLVRFPQAMHRETSSSPAKGLHGYTWDPRASWGRPHLAHEFAWWQSPGMARSCLACGFAAVARPLQLVRGLGVFLKQD